jgi:hypothetical protein
MERNGNKEHSTNADVEPRLATKEKIQNQPVGRSALGRDIKKSVLICLSNLRRLSIRGKNCDAKRARYSRVLMYGSSSLTMKPPLTGENEVPPYKKARGIK